MEGGKPTIITNSEGARTTPSVVAFTKAGDRLVGQVSVWSPALWRRAFVLLFALEVSTCVLAFQCHVCIPQTDMRPSSLLFEGAWCTQRHGLDNPYAMEEVSTCVQLSVKA